MGNTHSAISTFNNDHVKMNKTFKVTVSDFGD